MAADAPPVSMYSYSTPDPLNAGHGPKKVIVDSANQVTAIARVPHSSEERIHLLTKSGNGWDTVSANNRLWVQGINGGSQDVLFLGSTRPNQCGEKTIFWKQGNNPPRIFASQYR